MFWNSFLRAFGPAMALMTLLVPWNVTSVPLPHSFSKKADTANLLHTAHPHNFLQNDRFGDSGEGEGNGTFDVKNLVHQHNTLRNANGRQPSQHLARRSNKLKNELTATSMQQRSVTSTQTPSAFTQKDPFAEFVASRKQHQGEAATSQVTEERAELQSQESEKGQQERESAAEGTDTVKNTLVMVSEREGEANESATRSESKQQQTPGEGESKQAVSAGINKVPEAIHPQTLEEKLYKTMPKTKLSDKDVAEFVDTKAVASNVRRLIGIKAGASLHLEKQQLIKPGCDIATFGPAHCANPENPDALKILWSLEHRKNSVYFYLAVLMLACGVILQLSFRILEKIVLKGGDLFAKDVMEAAFRQIAYITIADVILWGIMQSNLSSVMDQLVFGDVLPEQRDADKVLENVSPMLEVLFEEFFFVAVLLLIWYVVYVLYIFFVVRQLSAWMTKVDVESDILTIAQRAAAASRSFWKRICRRVDIEKANYIAHRYDFAEEVKAISVPGTDPSGFYFTEYLKACLMKTSVEMLRLPNTTLLFLMAVAAILRPFFSLRLQQEAALLCSCSLASFLLLMVGYGIASSVKRQLLPKEVARYIVRHFEIESGEEPTEEASPSLTPQYKLQHQKDAWPGLFTRYFYGTTFPNKHQQLFCCWANGPNILMRIMEASCFCQLLVLAWWIQLLRTHPTNWLEMSWWGSVVVCGCAGLHFVCFKSALYSMLIAVKGGMLIDLPILKKVYELERAGSIRRAAELVEAFRIHSTLYEIERGGPVWWRQLQIEVQHVSAKEKEEMLSLWASLADEHKGVVEKKKLFLFLESEGLVHDEHDLEVFMRVFDKTQKGSLDETEFFALARTLKKLQLESLDENRLRGLFEDKFGISWEAATGVDSQTFSRILSDEFRLQWSEGQRRHFLDTITGRQTAGITPEMFCDQLQVLEKQTLQPPQEGNSAQGSPTRRGG